VVRRSHVVEEVAEQLRFAELPFRKSASTEPRSSARDRVREPRIDDASTFVLPELLGSFDLLLPEPVPLPDYQPEYAALEIGGSAGSGGLADDVLHLGVGLASARLPAGPYGAYEEVAVERRAVPAPENRKPRYPSRLLGRGIETNFNVYFVVDTTGTVDRETVELPQTVQQEFTSAVSEVLSNWRFVPAELGGRRVRQRVLQPFLFRVEGQYSSFGRE
jgi:TonB family protein